MKKLLSTILTAIMLLSVSVSAFATDAPALLLCLNNERINATSSTAIEEKEEGEIIFILDAEYLRGAHVIEDENKVLINKTEKITNEIYIENSITLIPKEGVQTNEMLEEIYNENTKLKVLAISDGERDTVTVEAPNQYLSAYDAAISVLGWVRCYYWQSYDSAGHPTIKPTGCEGGVSVLDSTVRVISDHAKMGCFGYATGLGIVQQETETTVVGSSWQLDTPDTWVAVRDDDGRALVGANCTYTMQRIRSTSGHTWDLYIQVLIRESAFGV